MDDGEHRLDPLADSVDVALIANGDPDAIRIGELYDKARKSYVGSVRHLIECGRELAKKKASLTHGEWLQWLKANAGLLGFSSRQTAARLLKLAKDSPENVSLTQHLDENAALQISRQVWGNGARPPICTNN